MTKKLPLVSVIIPYREDRGWLQDAIASVEAQEYDGLIEIIEAQGAFPVGHNINAGLAKSMGTLITYLCEDDLLPKDAIALSVAHFLANADIDFLHGNAENFSETGHVQHWVPECKHPLIADLLQFNHIHGGTVMYRSTFFEKYGNYDEELLTSEEVEMHMRALYHGAKIGYVDAVLYRYRLHSRQKHRRNVLANGETREEHRNRFKEKYR